MGCVMGLCGVGGFCVGVVFSKELMELGRILRWDGVSNGFDGSGEDFELWRGLQKDLIELWRILSCVGFPEGFDRVA